MGGGWRDGLGNCLRDCLGDCWGGRGVLTAGARPAASAAPPQNRHLSETRHFRDSKSFHAVPVGRPSAARRVLRVAMRRMRWPFLAPLQPAAHEDALCRVLARPCRAGRKIRNTVILHILRLGCLRRPAQGRRKAVKQTFSRFKIPPRRPGGTAQRRKARPVRSNAPYASAFLAPLQPAAHRDALCECWPALAGREGKSSAPPISGFCGQRSAAAEPQSRSKPPSRHLEVTTAFSQFKILPHSSMPSRWDGPAPQGASCA